MKYIYVSGGACRKSVYDPVLGRLTKKEIAKLVAKLFPGKFHVQQHPNLQTDIVIIPDGVCYVSNTTQFKLRQGVQVLNWGDWKRKYFTKQKSNRAGGGSVRKPTAKPATKKTERQMLQESLKEEEVAAKGSGRHWRLRRARELLAKNSKRPSATRGWSLDYPLKGKERQELNRACPRCFLGPNLSFPVCKRCTNGNCHGCAYDLRGANAAYRRARQYGYTEIAAKADRLRKSLA